MIRIEQLKRQVYENRMNQMNRMAQAPQPTQVPSRSYVPMYQRTPSTNTTKEEEQSQDTCWKYIIQMFCNDPNR